MNTKQYISWLAKKLSDGLDALDNSRDYEILPQVGDYKYQPKQGKIRRKQKPIITGTLISRQDELVPINGYELFTVTALMTLVVRMSDVGDVLDYVSQFVMSENGKTVTYTDIVDDPNVAGDQSHSYDVQYVLSTPTVVNLDQRQGAGTSAEIRLFITTVVSEEAIYGSKINLSVLVEGTTYERLQVLQGALQVVKTYRSNNVGNDEWVNNVPTSQSITITAKVAYRKTTKLTGIVGDILSGNLDKKYQIAYSDGAAYQESSPWIMNMTIGQGTVSWAPGEMGAIDLVLYRYEPIAEA